MTSERQRRANRANAKASTGPKTASGKARAKRNALRHGLAVSVVENPQCAPEVEALARRIADESADPVLLDLARPIAEAQIDLLCVRAHRLRLIASACADPLHEPPEAERQRLKIAKALVKMAPNRPMPPKSEPQSPQGAEELATTLSDLSLELKRLDRYERRLRSRRRFAIRTFDARRVERAK